MASMISKIIGHCNGGNGLVAIHLALAREWGSIVGASLIDVVAFGGVRFVKQSVNEASMKFGVRSGGAVRTKLVVAVGVLSSAALVVRSCSGYIVDEIKQLTGMSDVELLFRHVSSIPKKVETQLGHGRQNTDDTPICEIDEVFENASLKRALELLKVEMQNAA